MTQRFFLEKIVLVGRAESHNKETKEQHMNIVNGVNGFLIEIIILVSVVVTKATKKHPVKLIAHHIYNWKDNPDKRYDIDNGITLCEDCHLMFHILFGKKDNNLLQLNEFLLEYGKKIC